MWVFDRAKIFFWAHPNATDQFRTKLKIFLPFQNFKIKSHNPATLTHTWKTTHNNFLPHVPRLSTKTKVHLTNDSSKQTSIFTQSDSSYPIKNIHILALFRHPMLSSIKSQNLPPPALFKIPLSNFFFAIKVWFYSKGSNKHMGLNKRTTWQILEKLICV